jgi:hypothetical protein
VVSAADPYGRNLDSLDRNIVINFRINSKTNVFIFTNLLKQTKVFMAAYPLP